jgi:predicted ArsR family transcriptional regulator
MLYRPSPFSFRTVRRKVGRPYHVYSLSEKGTELFPKRYARLSTRLLEELKRQFPSEVVTELFHNVVQEIVAEQEEEFENLAFEDRLKFLIDLLAEEGFLARWEEQDGEYHLVEYSCPYISLGKEHTEICTFDKELIVSVLRRDVEQHSCMLTGAHCCEFSFAGPAHEAS